MKVGDGQQIAIHEETNYPFDEVIRLTVQTDKEVEFPLYLRIPTWANQAQIHINGQKVTTPLPADNMLVSAALGKTTIKWN